MDIFIVGKCKGNILIQCKNNMVLEIDCEVMGKLCDWVNYEDGTVGYNCVELFCIFSCDDLECGLDGCGGVCGECYGDVGCIDGLCECVLSCEDKQCGDDGCGGSCGECVYWKEVCLNGLCIC